MEQITAADWETIRRIFGAGFASSFYFSVGTVGEDGSPNLTPIGSILLGDPGKGVYFDAYAGGLGRRVDHDNRVCVMAIDASRWRLLQALWRGEARSPYGVRLHGTVGARRPATEAELTRFHRRVSPLRFLRGHGLLWGHLKTVRDLHFHAFERVRIGPLGDPWPGGAPDAGRAE